MIREAWKQASLFFYSRYIFSNKMHHIRKQKNRPHASTKEKIGFERLMKRFHIYTSELLLISQFDFIVICDIFKAVVYMMTVFTL